MSQQLSWPEAKSILRQLEELYSDPSDGLRVHQVKGVLTRLRETVTTRQMSARECIRELSTKVQAVEREIAAEPEKAQARREAELAEMSDALRDEARRVEDLQAQALRLRDQAESVQREDELTATFAEETVEAHARDMPRVQYAMSLYATITGIKWDYNAPSHVLRGWISSSRLGEEAVLPFEFDLSIAHPGEKFRITNALWSIMDGKVPEEVGAAPADF